MSRNVALASLVATDDKCTLCDNPLPASNRIKCNKGHYICKTCIRECERCPECSDDYNNVEFKCNFEYKGCKFMLSKRKQYLQHQEQCKFRLTRCEGNKFAKWNCDWQGDATDVYEHFKQCHKEKCNMQYKNDAIIKLNLRRDYSDVRMISFYNGQYYFYYKHRIDTRRCKVYWTFQLLGLESQARNYYYEFEVYKGPIRKFKRTEMCQHDTVDTDDVFDKESCVAMSFETVKHFLNENDELSLKFRIMSVKKVIQS